MTPFRPSRVCTFHRHEGAVRFAREATHFIAEINAIRPFREGNGRTPLAFRRLLCLNAGWRFEASVLDPGRVIGAMIESFDGMLDAVTDLIRDIASPKM